MIRFVNYQSYCDRAEYCKTDTHENWYSGRPWWFPSERINQIVAYFIGP